MRDYGWHNLTVSDGRTADCHQHNCKREHLQFQCSCPSQDLANAWLDGFRVTARLHF